MDNKLKGICLIAVFLSITAISLAGSASDSCGCGLARAYLNTTQDNLPSGTYQKIKLNATNINPYGEFDTTNFTYIAPTSGYYLYSYEVRFTSTTAMKPYNVRTAINNNTSVFYDGATIQSSISNEISTIVTDTVYLNQGDNISIYARSDDGASTTDLTKGSASTWFSISLIR